MSADSGSAVGGFEDEFDYAWYAYRSFFFALLMTPVTFFSPSLTVDLHAVLRTASYHASSIRSCRRLNGAAGRFLRSQESLSTEETPP
jgi:hypothetical protein